MESVIEFRNVVTRLGGVAVLDGLSAASSPAFLVRRNLVQRAWRVPPFASNATMAASAASSTA